MAAGDPLSPPSFAELQAWAGRGRVVRAQGQDLVAWQLPVQQKAALVSSGVPLLDGIIDAVVFETGPDLYRLAAYDLESGAGSTYAAEPETGRVLETQASIGSTRLVNSTVSQWLCSLHLVGVWLAESNAIRHWDEDPAVEEAVLSELADLLPAGCCPRMVAGHPIPGLVLDLDATLVVCHSEKEQAAKTWKKSFGYHPLLCFLDATGEALSVVRCAPARQRRIEHGRGPHRCAGHGVGPDPRRAPLWQRHPDPL